MIIIWSKFQIIYYFSKCIVIWLLISPYCFYWLLSHIRRRFISLKALHFLFPQSKSQMPISLGQSSFELPIYFILCTNQCGFFSSFTTEYISFNNERCNRYIKIINNHTHSLLLQFIFFFSNIEYWKIFHILIMIYKLNIYFICTATQNTVYFVENSDMSMLISV